MNPVKKSIMSGGWVDMGLPDDILTAINTNFPSWTLPTDVQDECIPIILGGGDCLASAPTGSGKTGAFAIPTIAVCEEWYAHDERRRKSTLLPPPSPTATTETIPIAKATTVSTIDRSPSVSVSPCGLIVQSRPANSWAGGRSTVGVKSTSTSTTSSTMLATKFYYETTIEDEGIVRLGFSTLKSKLELGKDPSGYGFGGTGMKSNNNKFVVYDNGTGYGMNDVVGCLLDLDSRTIAYSLNGRELGKAFDVPIPTIAEGLFPAFALKNAQCKFNFSGPFSFPPSSAFHPVVVGVCPPTTTVLNDNFPSNSSNQQSTQNTGRGPIAIVVAPVRDLAEQTYNTLKSLSAFGGTRAKRSERALMKKKNNLQATTKLTNIIPNSLARSPPPCSIKNAHKLASLGAEPKIQTHLLVGGISPKKTLEALRADNVDVLVGTVPIISEFVRSGKVQLKRCQMFVLDEADQLISSDLSDKIEDIYFRLPKVKSGCFKVSVLLLRSLSNIALFLGFSLDLRIVGMACFWTVPE